MDLIKFLKYCKGNCYSTNTIKTYKSVLQQYVKSYSNIGSVKKKLKSYFDSPNTV